jgi:hypothetical protein
MRGRGTSREGKYGIMCPVLKKWDVTMWDNYRAGTLLCTTYKLLANILYIKLVPYAVEIIGEYHGRFRRGRSTFDQIFTVRQ